MNIKDLWNNLPESGQNLDVDEFCRLTEKYKDLLSEMEKVVKQKRKLEMGILECIAENWTPENIAIALFDSMETRSKAFNAARRGQRSYRYMGATHQVPFVLQRAVNLRKRSVLDITSS